MLRPAIVVISCASLLAFAAPARADLDEEKAAWEQRFGPFEELVQKHSLPVPNDSAKMLEVLVPRIGLRLAPHARAAEASAPPAPIAAPPTDWLRQELGRGAGSVGSIPDDVRAWTEANAAAIAEVTHVLVAWEPPLWEEDLRSARHPNLTGHGKLVKVLVGDALIAEDAGDATRRDADLLAAWTLVSALTRRANLMCALVAVSEARMIAVALREIRSPSPTWDGRLDDQPFRDAVLQGFRADALFQIELGEGKRSLPDAKDHGRVVSWALGVATRIVATRETASLLPVAEDLVDDAPCGPPRGTTGLLSRVLPSSGTIEAHVPARVDALALHFELTRRVLALRRASADGALPAAPPDHVATKSCPDLRWSWTTDGTKRRLALEGASATTPAPPWTVVDRSPFEITLTSP